MECSTKRERQVRRRLNEYYGSHEVDEVDCLDEDTYRARLIDGTVVIVDVDEFENLSFREIMSGC